MTEIELLKRIKNNPSDFSELFKLYYKPIFGYIFRRIGDFDDTADIAADTFFKAFKHIHNFSYKGISVKVWLYRIATNEVNLYFRQQQKHISLFERVDFEDKNKFNHYARDDTQTPLISTFRELTDQKGYMAAVLFIVLPVILIIINLLTIRQLFFLYGNTKVPMFIRTVLAQILIIILSLLILIIYFL